MCEKDKDTTLSERLEKARELSEILHEQVKIAGISEEEVQNDVDKIYKDIKKSN